MRFKKAILGVAIGSAAMTAWAAGPEFGPGLFDMGEPRADGGSRFVVWLRVGPRQPPAGQAA